MHCFNQIIDGYSWKAVAQDLFKIDRMKLVGTIAACWLLRNQHAGDPGSILGRGEKIICIFFTCYIWRPTLNDPPNGSEHIRVEFRFVNV